MHERYENPKCTNAFILHMFHKIVKFYIYLDLAFNWSFDDFLRYPFEFPN